MNRLDGKVVIVAGGGSGIGAETARCLAAEGAAVLVADLSATAAEAVAQEIAGKGGQVRSVAVDIGDENSVQAMIRLAVEAFGGVDGIHVNAADMKVIHADTDAVDVALEVFDRTLAVNLRGHLLCTRHAIPELLKRGGGALVYTGSVAGVRGEPVRVAYGISKHGQIGLMHHVAQRWGREGIRANVVAPGFVVGEGQRSRMSAEQIASIEAQFCSLAHTTRAGRTGDIAAMVVLLMSDEGQWINGQTISIDGGLTLR